MNNNELLVSIIIPVYQAKEYLNKCIESVISQTYSEWEMILVDDGSTDGSDIICDEYANKYNKIKVIHKSNGGASSARNAGIDASIGNYIMFVDSDDYIDPLLCEDLVNYIEDETDIVISGFVEDYGGKRRINKLCSEEKCTVRQFKERFSFYYKSALLNSPWAKLYKADILKNVRFREDILIGEDFIFNLECYNSAKNITFVPVAGYYYNLFNNDSATKKYREEYFNCYKECFIAGKRFLYGEMKFINDALDEMFCLNCLYFIESTIGKFKTYKQRKSKIMRILNEPEFIRVCVLKYDIPWHVKITQHLCRRKYFCLLIVYIKIKNIFIGAKRNLTKK